MQTEPVQAVQTEPVQAEPVQAEPVQAVQAETIAAEPVQAVQTEPVQAEPVQAVQTEAVQAGADCTRGAQARRHELAGPTWAATMSSFGLRVQLVTATLLVVYRQGFRSPRSSAGVD